MGKTIKEALQEAASYLRRQNIDGPKVEAELLLAFFLGVERPYLYTHADAELSSDGCKHFEGLCRRRANGEPLAYIRKEKEFMGLRFHVESGIFIPRPETEHLVEAVLHWVRTGKGKKEGEDLNILELGTGSGCIAVSLAFYMPRASFVAVDKDAKALKTAQYNSRRQNVGARILFLQGHYFEALAALQGPKHFNIVVSNPPYIEKGIIPQLSPEVQHEPYQALNGGTDGLDAYREIIMGASDFLLPSGLLALELGAGQAADVIGIARRAGFASAEVCHDYAGIERVLLLQPGV